MGLSKSNKTSFKKGNIPWNKGKKCDYVRKRNLENNPSKDPKVKTKMRLDKLGKGSGWIDRYGYRMIRVNEVPMREHIFVWLKHNQLHRLPSGCCIHHLDGNKLNNSIDNLQLITRDNHGKFHADLQWNKI